MWEETTLRCALGPELPQVSYHDAQGCAKSVRYWAMTATEGAARPQNEVDAVRWLRTADAARLLSAIAIYSPASPRCRHERRRSTSSASGQLGAKL